MVCAFIKTPPSLFMFLKYDPVAAKETEVLIRLNFSNIPLYQVFYRIERVCPQKWYGLCYQDSQRFLKN